MIINVMHKVIDGAHFFVTDDKKAVGLCVAHADLEVAFNEVATQLNLLFKYNHGMECNFSPSVPFGQFKASGRGNSAWAFPTLSCPLF
jgi:hypothetical protein